MKRKPKCIIITGRAGSGKTTLAKKLGECLWMPVISRDEIKEGYVYHGDKRVADYRKTGEVSPPETYTPPEFDVPTIQVSTDGPYTPCIDELVGQIESLNAQ
jgi:SpoVK/Ycf46/Vps4 family AAA+-type ATPase